MANVDFPRGFIPARGKMDVEWFPLASDNPEIGLYDLVELRADGFYYPAQASSTTIVGSCAGRIAANSGGKVPVYSDPEMRYHAQADEGQIDAQTDLDLNYNITVGSPNSITGQSIMEIDSSTGAATATLPIKILRVVEIENQYGNALGANVLLECIINNHLHKSLGV